MKHKTKVYASSTDAESAFHKLFREVDDFVVKKEISVHSVKHKISRNSNSIFFMATAKIKYKKRNR